MAISDKALMAALLRFIDGQSKGAGHWKNREELTPSPWPEARLKIVDKVDDNERWIKVYRDGRLVGSLVYQLSSYAHIGTVPGQKPFK